MTTSSRFALGVSAALVSLSLALAPAAFAQDKMGKDDAHEEGYVRIHVQGCHEERRRHEEGRHDEERRHEERRRNEEELSRLADTMRPAVRGGPCRRRRDSSVTSSCAAALARGVTRVALGLLFDSGCGLPGGFLFLSRAIRAASAAAASASRCLLFGLFGFPRLLGLGPAGGRGRPLGFALLYRRIVQAGRERNLLRMSCFACAAAFCCQWRTIYCNPRASAALDRSRSARRGSSV